MKFIKNFRAYPNIALTNEQVYNNTLISSYLDAGYESIIVEWNNTFSANEKYLKIQDITLLKLNLMMEGL